MLTVIENVSSVLATVSVNSFGQLFAVAVLPGIACIVLVIGCYGGFSYLRYRRKRNGPVETLSAELVKIIYETGGSCGRVYFQVDGEKRRRGFEARRGTTVHLPEIGTKGTLICCGPVLYSFEWEDGKLVQDDPAYGKKGYSDLV